MIFLIGDKFPIKLEFKNIIRAKAEINGNELNKLWDLISLTQRWKWEHLVLMYWLFQIDTKLLLSLITRDTCLDIASTLIDSRSWKIHEEERY